MAVNVFKIIPYQINQSAPLTTAQATSIYLPSTGVSLQDVTNSPTRSLSTGVNAYTLVTSLVNGTKYYVSDTVASLVATINA